MEISIGALTYHHYNRDFNQHFEKCVGNCQAILNPMVDLGINNHHVFAGANSIARPMLGYRYNFPITNFSKFTVGAYTQDNSAYKKKGINVVGVGDFVPVAGFDLNYKSLGILFAYPLSILYWKF